MTEFLRAFLDRVDAVVLNDKTPGPTKEVAPGDIGIGILPEELRRWFIAMKNFEAEVRAECDKNHGRIRVIQAKSAASTSDEEKAFVRAHFLLHSQVETVSHLFWTGVCDAFPEATAGRALDIRKGWNVVTFHRRQPICLCANE